MSILIADLFAKCTFEFESCTLDHHIVFFEGEVFGDYDEIMEDLGVFFWGNMGEVEVC